MKRKGLFCFILAVLLMAASIVPAFASDARVLLDGQFLEANVIIVENRTLMPVRALTEAVGGTAEWDGETRQVTLTHGETIIFLTIDSTTAHVNSEAVVLDVPAQIINDSTFLPLRFIAESLGLTANWGYNTAILRSPDSVLTNDQLFEIARAGVSAYIPEPPPVTEPPPTVDEPPVQPEEPAELPPDPAPADPEPPIQEHPLAYRYPAVTRYWEPLTTINVTGSRGTVQTISFTSELRRNEEGRVQLIGQPAIYNLTILSAAGNRLTAAGLGDRQSNDDGFVRWYWLVGGNTGFGTQTATITVGGETFTFEIEIVPSN